MRILFVTPYVPSRIRVRPFQFIKALSTMHEVSLVSLVCDAYEEALVPYVADYCASVTLVPLSKRRAYANCLCALPTSLALRVAYYRSPQLLRHILRIVDECAIDVVHGELIKLVPPLLQVQKHVPVLFDSVDCISSYLQQQQRALSSPLRKAFARTELAKMCRYEPRSINAFTQSIITTGRDRDYLSQLGADAARIHVVPNGVDLDYFSPLTTPRETDSLVFCAKMDYYPNAQAMLSFCREVLPRIWQRRPQTRLTIVGNNPPQAVRELAADQRITVTGYVPDIRPYLGRASVALAPLHVAAGIQNKVLEALAMASPLVATPGTCGSLQVKHGTHLLIAEGPETYADAVLHLLDQPQLARSLGLAGRQHVEQHHSWAHAAQTLTRLYQNMLTPNEAAEQALATVAHHLYSR